MVDLKEVEYIDEYAPYVYVTYQDSIDAGNCEVESKQLADWIKQMYDTIVDINEVNLRGDELLSMRNDDFTRRAVQMAIMRKYDL